MQAELVHITTSDDIRLDGALHTADLSTQRHHSLDAIICLHGAGSNFYASRPFDSLTRALCQQSISLLRVNTRGHDGVWTTATTAGLRRLGGAYERVDECRLDIAAWVKFLTTRGYQRIGLLGHSLGAIKAIYASAHEPLEAVRRLIAVSPPRLSYRFFREIRRSGEFFDIYLTAKQLVADQQGTTLLDVSFPLPSQITAAGFIDKYGPAERYDILPLLDRLPCPTLITFGELELEHNEIFATMPAAIAAKDNGSLPPSVITIPRADHMYSGVCDELARRLIDWLDDNLTA